MQGVESLGQRSTDQVGSLFERYLCQKFNWELETSKWRQIAFGDTVCRVEIKYDRRLHQTGNLYIEGGESRKPNGKKVVSGPFKQCRAFVIGDCSRVMFFEPAKLREMLSRSDHRFLKRKPTSVGLVRKWDYMKWIAYEIHEWPVHPLEIEK